MRSHGAIILGRSQNFQVTKDMMALPPLPGFPGSSVAKSPPASAGATGNVGFMPGLGRSPGGGNGNPLKYSCLGNPIDKGAWQATVCEVPC